MPTDYHFEDLDLREEPPRSDRVGVGFSGSVCDTVRCPTVACTEACCTFYC
jgi:hypothetical protein